MSYLPNMSYISIDHYKLVISIMKNILVLKCRKLIPLGYIAAQILLSLSTWTLMLNFHMHLAFLVIATMAYFAVSLKDVNIDQFSPDTLNISRSRNNKTN
jgi:hypothetical protein